jgi:hypothetical protein
VIRTRATSIYRSPAIIRSAAAVASPARTISAICSTVKPLASRSASVQPRPGWPRAARVRGGGLEGVARATGGHGRLDQIMAGIATAAAAGALFRGRRGEA